MSSDQPLVSVVIPCFNHGRYLAESVQSALEQSHPNVEVMIVDDGSTDDTPAQATRFPEARYVRHERRRGLAQSRNTGLREARGELLVFLDADDRLLPDGVAAGVAQLTADPQLAFTFGAYEMLGADGERSPGRTAVISIEELYGELLRRNVVEMLATVMFRRGPLLAAEGFDPQLSACEDYDLLLRLAREHAASEHLTPVALYRQHESNMSRDHALMLRTSLQALAKQHRFASQDPVWSQRYDDGVRFWKRWYGSA